MKKLSLIALVIVVSFVASCSDDGPLKECVVCTQAGSTDPDPEYCANKVSAEAWKATMESKGATCYMK